MALSPRTRRRLLIAGVTASLAAVGLSQARPQAVEPVRSAAAAALSPVERVLTSHDRQVETLTRERDTARRALADATRQLADQDAGRAVQASLGSRVRYLPAHVVGFSTTGQADVLRRVTLDVGSADGVRRDQAVVAASGLAGRTIAVTAHSSTVQLITDPAAVVGVRVGDSGSLGWVSSTTPQGLTSRDPGRLTLQLVDGATVRAGQRLTTLGSPGNSPYPQGISVGTVVSVDPDRGQGGTTAVVEPTAALSRLNVVGVVSEVVPVAPRRVLPGTKS